MQIMGRWLDLEQAQRFLGLNRVSIWRLRKNRGLPVKIVGRQVFFRRSDLVKWKKRKEVVKYGQ